MEGEAQLLLQINTLTLKKEYLFKKLQKAYDLSKTVKLDSLDSVQNFMVQFSELDDARGDFEHIVMEIAMLEMQTDPKFKPSSGPLDSFDDLCYACKKVALNCNRLGQEPTEKMFVQKSDDCLARPVLPKLTLFEFDGEMENWTTFHDTFVSLVHSRNFENIDTFHYLLSCVKGPALNMVRSLPITAYNYPVVWQSLLDKYQDVRALTGRYLDKMLNFSPLTKDNVANLTSFVETFDHSLKAIQALEIKNLDDYLICHLALCGLDSHTRKLFEESRDQNKLPTFKELINFVNKQIKVLEHTFPTTGSRTNFNGQQIKVKSPVNFINMQPSHKPASFKYSNATSPSQKVGLAVSRDNNSNQNKLSCVHCNSNHLIYRCEQFRKLLVQDRIDRVNVLKLCTNCLKSGHDVSNCKSIMTCGVCARNHHYLLHRDASVVQAPAVPAPQLPRAALHAAGSSPSHSVSVTPASAVTENLHSVNENANSYGVVLGTTRTLVVDVTGQHQNCCVVLDSGAQSSFITLNCAQRLGLRRNKCPFTVSGLAGDIVKNFGMVTCDMKPCKSDVPSFQVDMVVVEKVSSEMPNVSFPQEVVDEYKNFELADPLFFEKSSIDILLGNDVLSELIKDKPMNVKSNIPKVIQTVFGYVVSGRLYNDGKQQSQNFHLSVSQEKTLDRTLRDFWEVEELPCKPVLSPPAQLAENIYALHHSRDEGGRYIVPLPFAPDAPLLGDSRAAAERRLLATERKLARSPVLQLAYNDFMLEYEKLDHMELYTGSEPSRYLIPYHSILRPSSTSTPLRVVFDASAKSSSNVSLNDTQLTGPNLYRDIGAIITNFRLFEYCFASDIYKMYRAILVRESDRKYQHILYRSSADEPIKVYELKTITYGVSSSPFLAIRTLLQLASDEGERFPSAANVVRQGIYMDDILWSCAMFSEACALQDELINMLQCGGLVLKKWSSNCEQLFERVPEEHREKTINFQKDRGDVSVKLLGLKWSPVFDAFSFSLNKRDTVNTKRSVLRTLASIYDPVGYIAPCTFVAKCILQDLWKLGLGWDDPLPVEECQQWVEFIDQLPRLSELQIERHILLPDVTECELVGFSDASSRGYAACIYFISRRHLEVKCRLLIAKSKVAPVKVETMPRMELMAATLLSKLMKYACECLSRIHVTRITALTDSSIVLAWIQTDAYKLKTFVCNRVTQIIESIPPHAWRHVNSENNMADVASRGVTPSQFMACRSQWFEGPAWMYGEHENWPVSTFINRNESEIPEIKSNSNTFNLLSQQAGEEDKLEFIERLCNQFSSFSKMQRSIAWILRFLRRFRGDVSVCSQEVLTTNDLNQAHDCLIKVVQGTYFKDEINTLNKGKTYIPSLRKLAPFIDARGSLRVGGRIPHSDLPYNAKHPMLLPKQSRFTKLLVEYFHKKYLHAGPQTLQNIINQRYWILSARSLIRSTLLKCKTCFKCKPTLLQPKMGNLPSTRLLPNKVFEHVGVDLAGPFYIKESLRRNAKIEKAYLAVFVCFSTKAVHLEALSSLSADCFLATLDRFVSRRGLSSHFYSDCGTNFIATSKHLGEVQKFMSDNGNQEYILNGCAQRLINWNFNPPSAPHMGGLWESCVRIAKYHLVRAVGDKALTFEELTTVFCKIEAIMNSRPLCALPASDNPNEFNVLTPGHFLLGKSLTAVPEYDLQTVPVNHMSRWQYLQNCSQLFWKKWSQDYLNTLQQRSKWFASPPNINVGDLVLVKDDRVSPCSWPLAIVHQTHPGLDGIVPKVTLKTKGNNILSRPVNKLCPLPYTN